jgi:uncharacterized protein YndB with AHSA1/START domain
MAILADAAPEWIWFALQWAALIGASTAGVLALIALVGCFYPRTYMAGRAVRSQQPPAEVWKVICDFAAVPGWHPEVKTVERLPDVDGQAVWRETDRRGYPVQLRTVEALAPLRLVRQIADENGPFIGQWEFDIQEVGQGSRITLTERGDIANPFFRVMFWAFMTPSFYLEMYLRALSTKLGDGAQLEKTA